MRFSFQTVYRSNIDFDALHEHLEKLGYNAKRFSAGRPRKKDGLQQQDAGNLTFNLKSGARINIFPKGKYHSIQAEWNTIEEMESNEVKLFELLVPFVLKETVMFSASHVFVRLKIPKNVELLRKIEALVSGKPYRKKKEPEDWKKAEGWKLVGESYVSYGSDVLDLVKNSRKKS
jgi:hypothetical protein